MIDNKKANTRIAKNTVFLTIRMIFVLVVSLYSSRLVLQVLGVEDFGIYNVVAGFVSMFSFLNSSMTNSVQRYYNFSLGKEGDYAITKVYVASLVIQLLLALLVLLLVETVGLWYLYHKMVIPDARFGAAFWVFHLSVFSMLFVIMQVPYTSAVMAYEKMDFFAIVSIIDVVLKLLIILLIPCLKGDSLIWYGILLLAIAVLNFLLYYIYAKKKFEYLKIKPVREKKLYKNMLSFSGWNLFGTFSSMMKEQGLNMLLNLFFGPIVNAARGVAYQVVSALRGFTTNIYTASRPQFTQSYAQGDSHRTIQLMYSTSKLCFILLFILSLPVMIEIEYVLNIWLGDNIPDHTSSFVTLVIISSLVCVFNPAMSFVVHATGKMRLYQVVGSLTDIFILPVSYMVLKMGCQPESVFVIYIIFSVIQQYICLVIVKGLVCFSIGDYIKRVWIPLIIIALCSSLISEYIHISIQQGFLRLAIITLVSSITVITLSYFMALNVSERLIFKKFLNKLIMKK